MSTAFNNLEDLAFSRSFRNWVLNKESPETAFWDNWVQRNPDKAEMVKNAKAVIYALHLHAAAVSAEAIDEEIRKALIRLKDAPRYIPLEGLERDRVRWRLGLRSPGQWVLAILAVLIGTGGFIYYRVHAGREVLQTFLNRHKPVREQGAKADTAFTLPDGSLVRLVKGSTLYFTEGGPDRTWREVFLRGQARFDIAKNAASAFTVFTDELVIKVLGTSFVVRTSSADGLTVVTDLSGKVALYREEDFYSPLADKGDPAGVVLMPNQEVVYDRKDELLHRTLCARPVPIGGLDTSVAYDRAPIRQVFNDLQEKFGIPIQFDEAVLDSCKVTMVLEAEPYYQQLDQVCKIIGGAYEVIDGNIVVSAVGCR